MNENLFNTKTIITPSSYSGADIRVYAVLPKDIGHITYENKVEFEADLEGGFNDYKFKPDNPYLTQHKNIVELGQIQTLSYSVYRDKIGVNVLGQDTPRGFTRGNTVFAGTMIFTVVHDRVLHELLDKHYGTTTDVYDWRDIRIDQLPPIDIFCVFENEIGDSSRLGIFGVEFMNEGQVMSINDLMTENSVNYLARYISPMRKTHEDGKMIIGNSGGSSSMLDVDYEKAKSEIESFRKRWL